MTGKRCEIVNDLLPMYVDECCSESSRQMVEEHLEQCPDCKRAYQEMSGQLPLPAEPPAQEEREAAPILKKGLQKIRRRWILSLVAAVVAVPLLILGWNQVRYLHRMWIANAFMSDLKRGDYEAAYRHMDVEELRERWLEHWIFDEETLANLEEDGLRIFLRSAQALKDAGNITEYQYNDSWSYPYDGSTNFMYTIYVDGEEYTYILEVRAGGIQSIWGIDRTTAPGQLTDWSENLWQDYKGCYFDWDTREYVWYEENP